MFMRTVNNAVCKMPVESTVTTLLSKHVKLCDMQQNFREVKFAKFAQFANTKI